MSPASASTKTWLAGAQGYYTAGGNWLGGAAPGPGDTAVINSSTPWFTDAEATHGDTIVQQTLDFEANSGSPLVCILGQTTFAPSTTLNFVGGVQADWGTVLKGYSDNALNGQINVGSTTTSGRLTLNVLDYRWNLHYTPTTTNNGSIAIAGGSVLHIFPNAGGAVVTFGPRGQISGYEWSTDLGHADFANNGLISLAPGAFLQDSWVTAGSGLYDSTLINNGTIRLQGADGQMTVAEINANLAGSGTILLDGGNAAHAGKTVLRVSGNVSGQHIVARNAGVEVHDPFGFDRVTGGSLSFGPGTSYLLVYPELGEDQPGRPSAVLPFGMPIKNFRAGNAIGIFRAAQWGIETFTPVWNQPTQQLTIWVTNSLHPGTKSPIARFTLEGNYGPDDFQATFDGSSQPTQIDITTTNNLPRTP